MNRIHTPTNIEEVGLFAFIVVIICSIAVGFFSALGIMIFWIVKLIAHWTGVQL